MASGSLWSRVLASGRPSGRSWRLDLGSGRVLEAGFGVWEARFGVWGSGTLDLGSGRPDLGSGRVLEAGFGVWEGPGGWIWGLRPFWDHFSEGF